MSARKPTRGRRDASGHVDPYFQRRVRFERALAPLGVWELFAAMPRRMQELLWKFKVNDPVLEFDDSVKDEALQRSVRRVVERGFHEAQIEINAEYGGGKMATRDFLAVIHGCWLSVQMTPRTGPRRPPEEMERFLDKAGPLLQRFYEEHQQAASLSLYRTVIGPLCAYSGLDTQMLTSRLEYQPTPNGKLVPRVMVRAIEPQVRNISLDGASRPMYRATTLWWGKEIEWLSWNGAQLGWGDPQKEYPVYVQSHALRQLRQRANLPGAAAFLDAWLSESLFKPNIVERQGENLLVEYRVNDGRVGYLVATPLKDQGGLVAVRTFLFLTMANTPEARMLEKRLRLTRRDVEWLGLCDLTTFTRTDLKSDPVLRALMEECGCGHLFALAEEENFAPQPKAFAAEMRRYLRMAA